MLQNVAVVSGWCHKISVSVRVSLSDFQILENETLALEALRAVDSIKVSVAAPGDNAVKLVTQLLKLLNVHSKVVAPAGGAASSCVCVSVSVRAWLAKITFTFTLIYFKQAKPT